MTVNQRLFLLCLVFILVTAITYGQQAPSTLTLQAAVDRYIERNLDLQAARFRVERAKADQIAARIRPNPGFTFAVESLPFSGPTPFKQLYEVSASYTETIELGGKRELRE